MTRKPGSLYLGQVLDPESGERTDDRLELDSDRLTTHGMIVGMPGSGKVWASFSSKRACLPGSPSSFSIRRETWGISC